MHTNCAQLPGVKFRTIATSNCQRVLGCPPDVLTHTCSQIRDRSARKGDVQLQGTSAPFRVSGICKLQSYLGITRGHRIQKLPLQAPCVVAGGKSCLNASGAETTVRQSEGQADSCQTSILQRRPKHPLTCCCSPAIQSPSTQLAESGNEESALFPVSKSKTPDSNGQASLVGTVGWRRVLLSLVFVLFLVWKDSPPALAAAAEGGAETGVAAFNFGAFGLRGSLTDRTPGLAYFALLMAAGCGLFVSEEALNVWVGGSLGRCLVVGGSREALMQSLRANGGYIASVIFWVYWGVCLSDLIPFFAGKWAAQRGESITEKLGGTNQSTLARVTATVRKYGTYIGFVERFSLGVRNPTAFLAGFSGVSTGTFFAGVCAGGALTLPLQMGLGFVLRDRPVAALATVAAIVGTWTIIPYASAALAAAWFFVKQRLDKDEKTRSNPS